MPLLAYAAAATGSLILTLALGVLELAGVKLL